MFVSWLPQREQTSRFRHRVRDSRGRIAAPFRRDQARLDGGTPSPYDQANMGSGRYGAVLKVRIHLPPAGSLRTFGPSRVFAPPLPDIRPAL
jgi:hypothetical protein